MAVTPLPGEATVVVTAGVAVQVVPASPAGGVITNPYDAPGALFLNPIDEATQEASGNTFALQPGQSWTVIPGQTSPTTVNSLSNDHVFSAVYWF